MQARYVDFVHKTFQEFLGAKAIVDSADLQFLVSRAHEDQWHETVVLAAGIAPQNQRDEFLRSLVARGEREIEHRHRLYLLAVACLETSVKLSPDVERLLDEHLKAVIPPRSITEARSLKAAGDLAVPLLRRKSAFSAREAAASVRALSMIGGDEALTALESYAEDSRLTVSREVVAAWGAFKNEEYARRVLANCPLEYGRLFFEKKINLENLHYLKKLRGLYLLDANPIEGLAPIARVEQLVSLYIQGMQKIRSIEPLSSLKNLMDLTLENASSLTSLAAFGNMTHLTELFLFGLKEVEELFDPRGLEKLKRFYSSGMIKGNWSPDARFSDSLLVYAATWPIEDLAILGNAKKLQSLDCRLSDTTKNVDTFATFSELRNLEVDLIGGATLEWMRALENIESLALKNIGDCNLSPVYEMKSLSDLRLGGASFIDVRRAVQNKKLTQLFLNNSTVDTVFPDLSNAVDLKILYLNNIRGLADVSSLGRIPNLERIGLLDCPDLRNLDTVRQQLSGRRVSIGFTD